MIIKELASINMEIRLRISCIPTLAKVIVDFKLEALIILRMSKEPILKSKHCYNCRSCIRCKS